MKEAIVRRFLPMLLGERTVGCIYRKILALCTKIVGMGIPDLIIMVDECHKASLGGID